MDLTARPLPWTDPETLFCAGPANADGGFWLDAGSAAVEGWSYLGIGESPVDVPREVAAAPSTPAPKRWGPFSGGWVGWLAYDPAAGRAGAPARDEGPGSRGVRVRAFVAIDHASRQQWAVAAPDELDAHVQRVARWAKTHAPALAPAPAIPTRSRHSAPRYADLIEACRDVIRQGDAYQLCLTTRFELDGAVDAVAAYRRLRRATPSHHGGFLRVGDHVLASASPERFLDIVGGTVRTHPIKGTRPRGRTPDDDAQLAAELRASAKEQAENVMIVDLMRNDLQRVCEPGSVAVERLLEVESYPAVHQLVSTVAGHVREGTTIGQVLDAAFPAGSMTGAPKLSAMTVLHRLEDGARGVFAGCFGWIGDEGAADLAMVIRSIFVGPDAAYVGAGGGITWSSITADEVAEVGIKARGPLAAAGGRLPAGW